MTQKRVTQLRNHSQMSCTSTRVFDLNGSVVGRCVYDPDIDCLFDCYFEALRYRMSQISRVNVHHFCAHFVHVDIRTRENLHADSRRFDMYGNRRSCGYLIGCGGYAQNLISSFEWESVPKILLHLLDVFDERDRFVRSFILISGSGMVLVMVSDELTVGVGLCCDNLLFKRYLDVAALCVMLRHLSQNNYRTA